MLKKQQSADSDKENEMSLVAWLRARFWPTLADMQRQKAVLKDTVLYWKYPNGMIVPPEKRGRLMSKLHRLDRRIRNHPDNR